MYHNNDITPSLTLAAIHFTKLWRVKFNYNYHLRITSTHTLTHSHTHTHTLTHSHTHTHTHIHPHIHTHTHTHTHTNKQEHTHMIMTSYILWKLLMNTEIVHSTQKDFKWLVLATGGGGGGVIVFHFVQFACFQNLGKEDVCGHLK